MQKNLDLYHALIGQTARGKLLAHFLEHPERSWFIAQAAQAAGVDPASAQRQLRQLEAFGLLESSSKGYGKFYRLRENGAVDLLQKLYSLSQ